MGFLNRKKQSKIQRAKIVTASISIAMTSALISISPSAHALDDLYSLGPKSECEVNQYSYMNDISNFSNGKCSNKKTLDRKEVYKNEISKLEELKKKFDLNARIHENTAAIDKLWDRHECQDEAISKNQECH